MRRVQVGGLSRGAWAGLARGLPQALRLVRRAGARHRLPQRRRHPACMARAAGTRARAPPPRPRGEGRRGRGRSDALLARHARGDVRRGRRARSPPPPPGAPRDRLRDVGTPVALAPPLPRPEWAGDGPVIGFAGRIEPRKGVLDLLRAAPAVLERRPDARFVLAGGGELERDSGYRAEVDAARAGLGDRVTMLGAVPDATALMPWFDVLAVPSLREPFGTVAAEALAAGTPAVVTDSGGMKEYVTERCGAVVPPSDPAALARGPADGARPRAGDGRRRARGRRALRRRPCGGRRGRRAPRGARSAPERVMRVAAGHARARAARARRRRHRPLRVLPARGAARVPRRTRSSS